jgi:hypothetical protein
MRLLTKSEINTKKVADKRREIDEGVKLARRVDNLREVAAQEEVALEKFRKETLKKIHKQTAEAQLELDELRTEVICLKKERRDALKPLDKEWAALREAQEKLKTDQDEHNIKSITLQESEKQCRKAIKQAADTLASATAKETRANELLQRGGEYSDEAETAMDHAKMVEAEALQLREDVEKELRQRDFEAAGRERSLDSREKKMREQEAKLNKEWLLLEDRKAMHERNIKRDKK